MDRRPRPSARSGRPGRALQQAFWRTVAEDQITLARITGASQGSLRRPFSFGEDSSDTPKCNRRAAAAFTRAWIWRVQCRSEEHTSELKSLMRISYAVFCLQTNNRTIY